MPRSMFDVDTPFDSADIEPLDLVRALQLEGVDVLVDGPAPQTPPPLRRRVRVRLAGASGEPHAQEGAHRDAKRA